MIVGGNSNAGGDSLKDADDGFEDWEDEMTEEDNGAEDGNNGQDGRENMSISTDRYDMI